LSFLEILLRATTHRFRPLLPVNIFFTTKLPVIAPLTNVAKIEQTPFFVASRMQAWGVREVRVNTNNPLISVEC
jgi:hypothetical protein